MLARLDRQHAMEAQAILATPYHDIAMTERHMLRPVAALHAAEQKDGGQPQRDRHDRLAEILLVAILVEAQACTGQRC